MKKTVYFFALACLLLTCGGAAFAQSKCNASCNVTKYVGKMQSMYDELNLLGDNVKFTKYMTYDFDADGKKEFWMSSDNDENQAIFSIVDGKLTLLASTYFKTSFSFYPGVIVSAGGCGTGCFSVEYTVLKNSKRVYLLNEMQSYNFEKDTMESEYSKDDKEISKAEGERIVNGFGKAVDVERKMIPVPYK